MNEPGVLISKEELRQLRSSATVGFTSEHANRVLDALEDAYRRLDEADGK
jgi:hypothetical protein